MSIKANTVRTDVITVRAADGFTAVEGLTSAAFAARIFFDGVEVVANLIADDGRLDENVEVGDLLLKEVATEPGRYSVRWRPGDKGQWKVVLWYQEVGDPNPPQEFEFSGDTQAADLDDVLSAVGGLPAADVLIELSGIADLRVDNAFNPVFKFRRKSTRALFDLEEFTSIRVLDSDAQTVIETIAAGNIARTALGTYTAEVSAVAAAKTIYLEPNFQLPENVGVNFNDIFRVLIFSADVIDAVTGGAVSGLERVYTCPTFLTNEGFNLDAMTDQAKWRIVRNASAMIDALTRQWFNGEPGPWYIDGKGRRIIAHKANIPIHGVSNIEVVADRTTYANSKFPSHTLQPTFAEEVTGLPTGTTLAATEWVAHNRAIQRVTGDFPGGGRNIKIQAVFGWVDDYRALATTSTSQVTSASNSVGVTDVSGFEARDVLDLVGADDRARVIITSVNRDTNTLYFDPLGSLISSIEIGATVRTYGKVPRPVEQVTNFIWGQLRREQLDNANDVEPMDPARIKREKTDDYEYELFPVGHSAAFMTGNARYDRMLSAYSMPAVVRVI